MFNIKPEYYLCDMHDEVTPVDDFGSPTVYSGFCPYCNRLVLAYYKCPGCGEEKPEHEFTLDEFDLCKKCFRAEVEAMSNEQNNPRRKQIIKFLKECS